MLLTYEQFHLEVSMCDAESSSALSHQSQLLVHSVSVHLLCKNFKPIECW